METQYWTILCTQLPEISSVIPVDMARPLSLARPPPPTHLLTHDVPTPASRMFVLHTRWYMVVASRDTKQARQVRLGASFGAVSLVHYPLPSLLPHSFWPAFRHTGFWPAAWAASSTQQVVMRTLHTTGFFMRLKQHTLISLQGGGGTKGQGKVEGVIPLDTARRGNHCKEGEPYHQTPL